MLTLVTGASGYLGVELVRRLREQGRAVRALVRSDTAAGRLGGMGVELAHGDVTDPGSLRGALDGVVRVFHLAGVVGHRAADEARLQAVNVVGAANLLAAAAAAGVERVVFTSTVGTLGPAGSPTHPRSEIHFLTDGDDGRPDFRYPRSKAAGERLALDAAQQGLDVVVVNPGFVIGPGDVNRVSSWPVEEYLRGWLRFTVRGGLSYVDARDVAAGHLLAEERGRSGERYVLTNDEGNLSHHDFFERVGHIAGRRRRTLNAPVGLLLPSLRLGSRLRLPMVPLDDQELRSSRYWWFSTAAKAREQLGFTARPLDSTIADTIAWLRADGYRRH